MYHEFIARLFAFQKEILNTYSNYLFKIKFRDAIINDLVMEILESWRLFGVIDIDYLKEKFVERDDIDMFMNKVKEIDVVGDEKFNIWWIGKFLSDMLISEIKGRDYSIEKMRDMIVLATELKDIAEGGIVPVRVWDFASSIGLRLETKHIDKVILKTGISLLDEQVKMADRTVTVFVAPWKRYKSILLTNIGALALAQGLSVFHVHYEGKKELWETRYDSCLSGVAISRLYSNLTNEEKGRILRVFGNLKKRGLNLFFMEAQPGGVGYLEIVSELDALKRQGIEFDVLIVDYLNLMKSSRKFSEDWKEQGQLAWDLVKLSQRGYVVVTAVQAKMDSAEREVLRVNDLGRSGIIAQAVTNMVAINQTTTEREQGCIRLSPLAIRSGEITKRMIPIELLLWKMRLSKETEGLLNSLSKEEF